jgi:Uma2 family endonuclease
MSRPESLQLKYSFYGLRSETGRFEILNGNLWLIHAPGTKHQAVTLRMAVALHRHIDAGDLGQVFQAPYDVVLSRANVIQPDILFVRKERRGMVSEINLQGAPDLVIEVLSQGTRERDIKLKRKIYADFGIPEYWIVDPVFETVEVLIWSEMGYASAGVCRNSDRLYSPLLLLDLPLSSIFNFPGAAPNRKHARTFHRC